MVAGSPSDLAIPDGVIVDRTYLEELGINGRGDTAQIENRTVRVAALTHGIRAFTTTPYVFMTPDRARSLVGFGNNDATHLLVRVAPGANVQQVQAGLQARLADVEVVKPVSYTHLRAHET